MNGRECDVCSSNQSVSNHHIIARRLGGKTELDNLITLCGPCHDWAEIYAADARVRSEFLRCVDLYYPFPRSDITYSPAAKGCRLHGNWREWVYGGLAAPSWGCRCSSVAR